MAQRKKEEKTNIFVCSTAIVTFKMTKNNKLVKMVIYAQDI